MQYIVRVRHGSGRLEDKMSDHTTDSVVEDDLTKLGDAATKDYVDSVQKYDAGHTVSLFRDGVTVHESKGTGTTKLPDKLAENADDAGKLGVPPVVTKTS